MEIINQPLLVGKKKKGEVEIMTRDKYKKEGVAAQNAGEEDEKTNQRPVNPNANEYGFKAAGRAILDNPSEWGLIHRSESEEHIKDSDSDWEDALVDLKYENERYREALELIAMPKADRGDVELIAKEALKQQDND